MLKLDNLLFSIIMPNYNNGKYIKEAINSVLAQTYCNWELIIVDDASTDNSLSIIKPFLCNKAIKLISNKVNQGVAHAAKVAVDNSLGEIIGTLDSDDVLDKEALAIMINEHDSYPEYGLIYSNYYKCDDNLKIHSTVNLLDPLPDNISMQEILLGPKSEATISTHFRTFKKSVYYKTEGYDIVLRCYEDRDLYYKLEKVAKVRCINRCLLFYRDKKEEGAYRRNSEAQYYWFLCEYHEASRRLRIKLPLANKSKSSLFLANLMYIYLRKSRHIVKKKLRRKFHLFFLELGFHNLKTNKLSAYLLLLNSLLYGYTPITFKTFKKLRLFRISSG